MKTSTSKKSSSQLRSPFEKETYEKNAEIYKLLAHPTRLEILNILKNTDASVDELATLLGLRKANISQHLSVLRLARAVKVSRSGTRRLYAIADPRIVEPCRVFRKLWRS